MARPNPKLLSVLACPRCKGALSLGGDEKSLTCVRCNLVYPIKNGVPQLIALEASPATGGGRSEDSHPSHRGLGQKIRFLVVEGKDKGEAVELEKGSCRAIGRSLDETERTRAFSVDSALSLDDFSKKLVMNYVSQQDKKPSVPAASIGETLGSFVRQKDIFLRDSAVSRLHAMLFYGEVGIGILDLVSKNGTYVNGVEVESKPLKRGDLVTMGGTKLRVE